MKKLHSKRMADFRREVAALRKFAVSPHSHVVKLLAAFRHGTRFYLLFPWAKGDLCSFWKENTKPIIDKTLSRWTTEQFLGIADALRQVHRDHNHNASEARVESEESGIVDDSRYGYHGDLKPENILQFESGDCGGKHGLLSLSDFGLGRLHGRPQKQVDIRPIGFTPTYRAPELDAKGTIGSAYDIWSLGCILLETIIWMLHGREGIRSFALSRITLGKRANRTRWRDDGFFQLVVSRSRDTLEAKLKPSVVKVRSTSPVYIHILMI